MHLNTAISSALGIGVLETGTAIFFSRALENTDLEWAKALQKSGFKCTQDCRIWRRYAGVDHSWHGR